MKALLYCTKYPKYLYNVLGKYVVFNKLQDFMQDGKQATPYNGKIIAECNIDTEEIAIHVTDVGVGHDTIYYTENMEVDELTKRSCLDIPYLNYYLGYDKSGEIVGYALTIKNLHLFNEPKSLNEYYGYYKSTTVNRAPQNMMLVTSEVEDYEGLDLPKDKYVLLSIRPEWLCKIANKEKDVEVRKVVLKEMLP